MRYRRRSLGIVLCNSLVITLWISSKHNTFADTACDSSSGKFKGNKAKIVVYVSPYGNDSWSGTLPAPNRTKTDGPFATPVRARDALRAQSGLFGCDKR